MSDVSEVTWKVLMACGVLLLAFTVGVCTGAWSVVELKREAIERGYAIYDSQTGEWRWIEETEGTSHDDT